MTKTEVGATYFEDGGRDHKPRMQVPLEAGKGKEVNSPSESTEGVGHRQYLDFNQVEHIWDF